MTARHEVKRSVLLAVAAAAGLALLRAAAPAPLGAQDTDARWLPWLGCWESAGGGAETLSLCVRPSRSASGITVVEVADGEVVASETVVADGVRRESTREGCTGWEEARFSEDGRRVYVSSEHVCEGGVRRTSSGILAMASPTEWLDVRSLDVEGQPTAWVRRYVLAPSGTAAEAGIEDPTAGRTMAVDAARMAASAPVGADAVVEASGRVHAEAVKAWIVELDDPLRVDARRLVRMADRGVPPDVIDVVVALSYPGRFALQDGAVSDRDEAGYGGGDPYGRGPVRGGVGWSPFYSPWGYGYGYGYGYGLGPYGYYGYRPTVVVVRPRQTSGVSRLVKGLGYWGRGSSGGTAGSGASGATASGGGGDAGGSGAAASGGGSSSTGRKAKPRGGRGGGGSGG